MCYISSELTALGGTSGDNYGILGHLLWRQKDFMQAQRKHCSSEGTSSGLHDVQCDKYVTMVTQAPGQKGGKKDRSQLKFIC